jgi:hypothetical protein
VWRVLGWALALACLAGVLPGVGAAAPAVRAGASDGGWTDARIRAAVDLDHRPPAPGPATTRLAAAPTPIRRATAWTTAGGVSRAVGRVFYALRSRDYSCTGVAVRSANRSTVLTAGHCVNAGPGPYATDWVFVPGYRDGRRPYGTWAATRLAAPAGWVRTGTTADDVGYAVVAPRAGRRLTDVVGSLPVAFDAPRGAYVWALGYPAAAPNAGRRALYCRGTVRADPYRTGSQGLACTMTQGASGGPWLTMAPGDPAGRPGAVYAVTSFTYRGMSGVVWAPYLGRTARLLYTTVQRR